MSRSTISTFKVFEMWPDTESARVYLESRLWPNGPVCPVCNSGESVVALKRVGYYDCNACRSQARTNEVFTVRTGTIFERSKIPLRDWLHVIALMCDDPEIPSERVAEEIGVTQKSAWKMLEKIREACGDSLSALDVDERNSRVLADWPAYRVDVDGSIWTRYRRGKGGRLGLAWRQINPSIDSDGYHVVRLYRERGAWKQLRLARLICAAFNGPCPTGLEVRHLDGNRMRDAVDNLAWGTSKENSADQKQHGTQPLGETHHNARLTDAQVAEIRALKGKRLQREVAAQFGTTQGYISELWGSRSAKRREVVND